MDYDFSQNNIFYADMSSGCLNQKLDLEAQEFFAKEDKNKEMPKKEKPVWKGA